ncbi:MAG: dicarboxylate/amino acid:cation symporter [Flavobacteriales bacterium]|nr:MAG: dicarboxylate/amino acid:cation symporter [Flavobacteriales bacterium]
MELHWQILIGLTLGVLFGIYIPEHVEYVAWMGTMFMRALKMVIIPLIMTSLISGITNIGSMDKLGKMGAKTITYYISTSLIAIIIGLFFVNMLQPGIGANLSFAQNVEGLGMAQESFGKTLKEIIPTNIFEAMVTGKMLSLIFFSILIGIFITKINKKHSVLFIDIANGGFELMMKVTQFVIRFTPLGVLGIVANQVATQDNLSEVASRLGLFSVAVIGALAVHSIIVLPLMLKFIGKINPFKHFGAMKIPLLTAFSTSSSSATLPLTIDAIENKAGASNKVSSFVLPLGATINMDGTALYECIGAIFIAQAYGLDLSVTEQLIVVLTALLASIGAAGIPMAGLVMMSVILSAIGLPLEGVGLILAVDRPLDMLRTAINVWSDSCGTVIIAKSEGEKLNYPQI